MARDVYRVRAHISGVILSSQQDRVLHVADVQKTLVRTIIELTFGNGATGVQAFHWELNVIPKGYDEPTIFVPGAADEYDVYVPDNLIVEEMGIMPSTGTTAQHIHKVFKDIKSMRKLARDDYISYSDIVQVDTSTVDGTITMFFKDA